MPAISWKIQGNFEKAVVVQNAIRAAVSQFFAPGIQKVQDECNRLSKEYQQSWQQKGPAEKMTAFGLPDISYADGRKEIQPPFQFTEPESIDIEVVDTLCPLGADIAALALPSSDPARKPVMRVYLGALDVVGKNIVWRGFSTPFSHVIFHELAHICGDPPLNQAIVKDGVLRHTLICGKALDNLSGKVN